MYADRPGISQLQNQKRGYAKDNSCLQVSQSSSLGTSHLQSQKKGYATESCWLQVSRNSRPGTIQLQNQKEDVLKMMFVSKCLRAGISWHMSLLWFRQTSLPNQLVRQLCPCKALNVPVTHAADCR